MLRPNLVGRAVRLLGAVAVTGALSAGALTTAAAAETPSSFKYSGVYSASGENRPGANGLDFRSYFKVTRANGL